MADSALPDLPYDRSHRCRTPSWRWLTPANMLSECSRHDIAGTAIESTRQHYGPSTRMARTSPCER